jgi:hypothetical protein
MADELTAPSPKIDFRGLVQNHAADTGWTVWELFREAGVSYSNWPRWLSGETSPNVRVLERLLAVRTKEAKP